MSRVIVKVKRLMPEAKLPTYEHPGDSGDELVAVADYTLQPMLWFAIPTGILAVLVPQTQLTLR